MSLLVICEPYKTLPIDKNHQSSNIPYTSTKILKIN